MAIQASVIETDGTGGQPKMNGRKSKPPRRAAGAKQMAAAEALRQLDQLRENRELCPRMYTPDRVLDTAYCFYVVALMKELHDPPEAEINRLATRVVEAFHWVSQHTKPGSPEWLFMNALDQIVVSLARGIYRRKQIYENQLRVAAQKKEMQISQITDVTRQEGFLRACLRGLLVGGFGYALVHTLMPSLEMAENTNPNYASLATAIALVLLTAVVKSVIMNRRIIRIFDDYEHAQLHANISYQQAALEEYTRAEMAACNAWEQFTGEKHLNWPGFEEVLRTDLERQQRLEEQREKLEKSTIIRAMGALKKLGKNNGESKPDDEAKPHS